MKCEYFDGPTPHLILGEVFSDKQLRSIWREIDYFSQHMKDPDKTGSAADDGTPLKNNKGLMLGEFLGQENYSRSHIVYNTRYTAWGCGLSSHFRSKWMKNMYDNSNWDGTILSYYDTGDHYNRHCDNSAFTMLIWLWREPKKFTGGNFYFTDQSNYEIECKNNSGVVFMSSEYHAVSPVQVEEEGFGRYTITLMSGIKPN